MKKYFMIMIIFSLFASFSFAKEIKKEMKETDVKKVELKVKYKLADTANDDGTSAEFSMIPGNTPDEIKYYTLEIYKNGKLVKTEKKENSGNKIILMLSAPKAGTSIHLKIYGILPDGSKTEEFIKTDVLKTRAEWINTERITALIWSIIFVIFIVLFVKHAKKGKDLFIRKIAGLDALDDAIGRATEMGRPIFYIPGISTVDDIATLASLNILRQVAREVAIYETPFKVPNTDPVVLTVSQDVVKEAYMSAGRLDLYDEKNVYLAAIGQFAYAGAVSGAMEREKPATVFLLGMFYAESLILAETGNSIGAIQIAGTDSTSQLPFFIASCDYTLIGEELYAASAYLSKEPLLLGTLKAQDIVKGVLILLLLISLVAKMLGSSALVNFFFG